MATLMGLIIVLAVAFVIAVPLMNPETESVAASTTGASNEWWQREKAVALLAIKEADFDRATGKLSDDDYSVLRHGYEERALEAMGELDRITTEALEPAAGRKEESAEATADSAAFCTACGRRFGDQDRFCAGCGTARS